MKLNLIFLILRYERQLQVILSSILSGLFLLSYFYHTSSIYTLSGSILFALLAIWAGLKSNTKIALLKTLSKANIKVQSTEHGFFIKSSYQKFLKLFGLIVTVTLGLCIAFFALYAQWNDGAFSPIISIMAAVFIIFSMIISLLIYSEFLPQAIVHEEYIAFQQFDLLKMKIYQSVKIKHLREIGLGKFQGYFYHHGQKVRFEKTHYWLFYGIDQDGTNYIFMEFDHTYPEVIFSTEWESDMKQLSEVLQKKIPRLKLNSEIRKLSNPDPTKGDKGWISTGIIE